MLFIIAWGIRRFTLNKKQKLSFWWKTPSLRLPSVYDWYLISKTRLQNELNFKNNMQKKLIKNSLWKREKDFYALNSASPKLFK